MGIEKTPYYKLKKPAYEDFCDINDLNENAEIVDTALNELDKAISEITAITYRDIDEIDTIVVVPPDLDLAISDEEIDDILYN